MLQVLSDVSWYVCFQLRILDVTELFVLKYCPLCLNITSKSETEMFGMNNQSKSRTVTQRVTKGHQIAVHLKPERRRLLFIQQRNQIIHRTIVDLPVYHIWTSAVHIKIIERLSMTFTANGERQKWNFCRLSPTLCAVESKYLYLLLILRDTFHFCVIYLMITRKE